MLHEEKMILSYRINIRFFAAIYMLLIILGNMLLFRQLLSSDNKFRYTDLFAIISGFLLLIWSFLLFLDSWTIIKVSDKRIEKKIFNFCLKLINFDDVIEIKETKTNQFENFVQGRIIVLITKQGEKIKISYKYENFDLFYKEFMSRSGGARVTDTQAFSN